MLPRLLTCSSVRSELRLEAEKSTVGLFGRWIARAAAVVEYRHSIVQWLEVRFDHRSKGSKETVLADVMTDAGLLSIAQMFAVYELSFSKSTEKYQVDKLKNPGKRQRDITYTSTLPCNV